MCVFRMDTHTHTPCVSLSVRPSRGMVDEKLSVLVQNCPPGSRLTVHALHSSEDGHAFHAFAHYCANTSGYVNGWWAQPQVERADTFRVVLNRRCFFRPQCRRT